MNTPDCIVIDFETWPIRQRPEYPPEPVGVSLRFPGEQRSTYWAWGHPDGNNCSKADGRQALEEVWASGLPLLYHNGKFDVAVATERMGLPMPPWDRIHDTMFLAYLADPHSRAVGLKQLAAQLLNWPQDEKDAVVEWVLANQKMLVARYPDLREINPKTGEPKNTIAPSKAGAWIFAAPGKLVGTYAEGDTDRTLALFHELYPLVMENGMRYAYDTEREVMPILMANERDGMRADVDRLAEDVTGYSWAMDTAEDWLRKELRASGLNFDADADVGSVLFDRGVVPAENWQTTDSGQLSMSKDNLLPEHFTGPNGSQVAAVLGYRNRLKTCLKMFMEPWLDQASRNGGYITTNWNQTRGTDQGGGTRTGRPSTNKHNFLNVSKKWDGRDDQYEHPAFLKVPTLPLCRGYVLPDPGETWIHRDFSSQELRIFAHLSQGDLWDQYAENPALDVHEFVGAELMAVAGREIERTRVKTLNFQGLYGGGAPALQRKLRCSLDEAKQLKAFHRKALPDLPTVNDEIKKVINLGGPIRTMGGRLYFAEPPGPDNRSKVYKLLNYLCQGGAADYTKRALIDFHNHPKRACRFLVTIYDESNYSTPTGIAREQMAVLREVMNEPRLGMTVPMLSDGKWGASWGTLQKGDPP